MENILDRFMNPTIDYASYSLKNTIHLTRTVIKKCSEKN